MSDQDTKSQGVCGVRGVCVKYLSLTSGFLVTVLPAKDKTLNVYGLDSSLSMWAAGPEKILKH